MAFMDAPPRGEDLHVSDGGGMIARFIEEYDWSQTSLGQRQNWAGPLQTLINLMIAAKQPMFLAWGPDWTWFYNDAFIPILGDKHPGALGRPSMDVWSEARDVLKPMFDRVFSGEAVSIPDFALDIARYGKVEEAHFEFGYTPVWGHAGRVEGLFGSCIETTSRIMAERRLAAATERQRRQFQCAPGFIAILNGPEHSFEFVNDAYVRLIGERDVVGKSVRMALPEIEGQGFLELLDRVYATGERYIAQRTPVSIIRGPEGKKEERYLDFVYEPIHDDANRISGIFVEGFDVTEAHLSEMKLHHLNETLEKRVEQRTLELEATQAALVQAQKMEAVGQLTGGIAHDFNNLLAGISGSLELVEARLAQGRIVELPRFVAIAQTATRRAAALTQRLLAFSRRQTLDAKPTKVDRLVAGMEEMIRRTAGPAIELEVVRDGDLWLTKIDPSQMESALLNLCINGRDAMVPAGGRLTIITSNIRVDDGQIGPQDIPPGEYVCLSVSDTGSGMEPEIVARVFDPFFTTKPLGEGTGLGLSMVYGFVRQSGGHVRITSRVGKGTTIHIYLPRLPHGLVDSEDVPVAPRVEPGKGQTILVTDDEPSVREVLLELLREQGYKVLQADTGAAGLGVIQSPVHIDLLITDVGLPGGINGRQLADAARQLRPDLKILFITGFAEAAVVGSGLAGSGMEIITKPFDLAKLSQKVRNLVSS